MPHLYRTLCPFVQHPGPSPLPMLVTSGGQDWKLVQTCANVWSLAHHYERNMKLTCTLIFTRGALAWCYSTDGTRCTLLITHICFVCALSTHHTQFIGLKEPRNTHWKQNVTIRDFHRKIKLTLWASVYIFLEWICIRKVLRLNEN